MPKQDKASSRHGIIQIHEYRRCAARNFKGQKYDSAIRFDRSPLQSYQDRSGRFIAEPHSWSCSSSTMATNLPDKMYKIRVSRLALQDEILVDSGIVKLISFSRSRPMIKYLLCERKTLRAGFITGRYSGLTQSLLGRSR